MTESHNYVRGSIAFHRLHSKTCLTAIPFFHFSKSVSQFSGYSTTRFLNRCKTTSTQLSLPKRTVNMFVSTHHRPPTTVGFVIFFILLPSYCSLYEHNYMASCS